MAKEKQWKKTGWYLMALEGDDLLIWDYRKPVRTGKDHRFIRFRNENKTAYKVLADSSTRDSTAPAFVGQLAQVTKGGAWYVGYGTSAGNWRWIGFGDFTPPSATAWSAGVTTPSEGDLVTVADQTLSTGNQIDAATSTTVALDSAAESFVDDEINGCMIVMTSGSASGARRRILSYDATTETATVDVWSTTPSAGDTYDIVWPGGNAVWECTSTGDGQVASTYFVSDWNAGYWTPYKVEDYHYHFRHVGRESLSHRITLSDGDLLNDWGHVFDELYRLLPTTGGGPGIAERWGSGYSRTGALVLSENTYYVSKPVKMIPLCSLEGVQKTASAEIMRIRATSDFDSGNGYLVEGALRNDDSSSSNFHTHLKNVFLDCDEVAKCHSGIYLASSHGGKIENVEVDGFTRAGIVVGTNADEFFAERIVLAKNLNETLTSDYGWWFEDNCKSINIMNTAVKRCDVGMSFGDVEAVNISGFDCENVGLPFEWRLKNHANLDGTAGDANGATGGCQIIGIRARRNSADLFVTSTRVLAIIRRTSQSGYETYSQVRLAGRTEDSQSTSPYDRIQTQLNNGTVYTYPLRWDIGYDQSLSGFDFDFDLEKMLKNVRFRSDNTKTQDSRLVCINNPATITADGTSNVAAEPGLYRIEVPSGGTWNGGALTVYQYSGGPVVPGLNAITAATDVYYHHPGGTMVVDFSGDSTSASSSVDIYFRPWLM